MTIPYIETSPLITALAAIDGTLVATYDLADQGSTDLNLAFLPLHLIVLSRTNVAVGPTLSVGSNGPNFTNVVTTTPIGQLTAGHYTILPIVPNALPLTPRIGASIPIVLNVSVGATTPCLLNVYLVHLQVNFIF